MTTSQGTQDGGGLDRIATLETRELSQQAYDAIRKAIRDMELRPGEHLVESTLARRLGTSSMPVREALLRLERDGFVRTIPFRGAFVTTHDRRDVEEIFELRELLEGRAAAHAARLLTEGSVDRLEQIIREVDDGIAGGDVALCHELFIEFDDLLFDGTDNARLGWELRNLRDQIARIGVALMSIPGRLEQSQVEHKHVVAALRSRDSGAAEREMSTHVRSLRNSLLGSDQGYLAILRGEKAPSF
jgi:DNA-binding GntR family transcriptional regulator